MASSNKEPMVVSFSAAAETRQPRRVLRVLESRPCERWAWRPVSVRDAHGLRTPQCDKQEQGRSDCHVLKDLEARGERQLAF
jgi:hypothetical protein